MLAVRVCELPPPCRWHIHSSGILRSVEWQFLTDISGQPIDPNLGVSDPRLSLEYGTDRLSQNTGKELPLYAE